MHAPVVTTLNGSTVPGLGPDLCHDRDLDQPHPSCGFSMSVAPGVLLSSRVEGVITGHPFTRSQRGQVPVSSLQVEGEGTSSSDSEYPQLSEPPEAASHRAASASFD